MTFEFGQKVIAHKFESSDLLPWIPSMASVVGKMGVVIRMTKDGNIIVLFPNGEDWAFIQSALVPFENGGSSDLSDEENKNGYRNPESYQHIDVSAYRYVKGYVRADRDYWMTACNLAVKELDKLEGMITVTDEIRESLDYLKQILR